MYINIFLFTRQDDIIKSSHCEKLLGIKIDSRRHF